MRFQERKGYFEELEALGVVLEGLDGRVVDYGHRKNEIPLKTRRNMLNIIIIKRIEGDLRR